MKTVNVTLILSLIAAGVLLVLAAVAFAGMLVMSALQGSVDLSRPAGEIGDVEGYALILGGLGWAIAAFGSLLFGVFAILLAVCGFLLILFAVIARAVYAPQGGRLTAHRVLMAIVCLGMAAGGFTVLSAGVNFQAVSQILFGLAYLADAAVCAFLTFTPRVNGVLFRRAPQPEDSFPPAV